MEGGFSSAELGRCTVPPPRLEAPKTATVDRRGVDTGSLPEQGISCRADPLPMVAGVLGGESIGDRSVTDLEPFRDADCPACQRRVYVPHVGAIAADPDLLKRAARRARSP